jgi:glycosyltransferase involved in cell wall biosynthesis
MTIFMCLDQLPAHFGPGTFVRELAPALRRAGHRVVVFVERPVDADNQYLLALRAADVPVRVPSRWVAAATRWTRIEELLLLALVPIRAALTSVDAVARRRPLRRSWRGVRGRLNRFLPTGSLADPPRWRLQRALDDEHRRQPADLVHMLTGIGSAFAWAAKRGVPIVYNENSVPRADYGIDWWTDVRNHVQEVHLTTSVCAAAEPSIRSFLGYRGPVMVIPSNLSDPCAGGTARIARDATLAGTLIIGTASRLTTTKCVDVLLRAMRVVFDRAPDARVQLWCAGDGVERTGLEALAASLGLADRVRFLGHCGQAAMARFWAAIDVFVLPSHWEGLPFVVLEAMAHAKPVVATTVGGVPEAVVDGVTGLLVPTEAVEPLAAAIASLLADSPRRAAFGAAGRARFLAMFRTEVVVERLLDAYRQVLSDAA